MLFESNWKLLLQSYKKCAEIYSCVTERKLSFEQLDCTLNSSAMVSHCCSSLNLQLLISTSLMDTANP